MLFFFFFLNNRSTFQYILIVQKGLMNTTEILQHTQKSLGAMHQWFLETRKFRYFFLCFVKIYIVFLSFQFRISLFIVMYSSPVLGYISLILPLISSGLSVEGGLGGICDRHCVKGTQGRSPWSTHHSWSEKCLEQKHVWNYLVVWDKAYSVQNLFSYTERLSFVITAFSGDFFFLSTKSLG